MIYINFFFRLCKQFCSHCDVRVLLSDVLQPGTQKLSVVEEVHHAVATLPILAAGTLLLRVDLLLQVSNPSSHSLDWLHPSFHHNCAFWRILLQSLREEEKRKLSGLRSSINFFITNCYNL